MLDKEVVEVRVCGTTFRFGAETEFDREFTTDVDVEVGVEAGVDDIDR